MFIHFSLLFVSSGPHYQAEFQYIESGLFSHDSRFPNNHNFGLMNEPYQKMTLR